MFDVIWFEERVETGLERVCPRGVLGTCARASQLGPGPRGRVCRPLRGSGAGRRALLASSVDGPATVGNRPQVTGQPHAASDPAQNVIVPRPRSPALHQDILGSFSSSSMYLFPKFSEAALELKITY